MLRTCGFCGRWQTSVLSGMPPISWESIGGQNLCNGVPAKQTRKLQPRSAFSLATGGWRGASRSRDGALLRPAHPPWPVELLSLPPCLGGCQLWQWLQDLHNEAGA